MVNLIPMAGEGKRFSDAGYAMPKPLIEVSGKPMIIRAIESMPKSEKWIFVCREEHIEKYGLEKILTNAVPNCEIITVKNTTQGQLSSCMLAKDVLNANEEVFIGACDNSMLWDRTKFGALTSDKSIDCALWTFTRQMNLVANPNAWGWVKTDGKNNVSGISVKVPISTDPFNDQAIVGSFWFKSTELFISAAEELIAKNMRTNKEFYIDSIPEVLIAQHKKVVTFTVDKYVGFGTPNDLKTYQYWESYFKRTILDQVNLGY